MTYTTYIKWVLVLALTGTLFSGYLSGVKFFSGVCALNEPCPYFFGIPACYFGFGLFLALLIATVFAYFEKISADVAIKTNLALSAFGILFAGYFALQELFTWVSDGSVVLYTLGLPTCVYGLVFYIAIFVLSFRVRHLMGA